MDEVTIPETISISLEKLKNYLFLKHKINLTINEEFVVNTLDDKYSYNLCKKGKNKNNVSIIKKRNKQNIKNKYLHIEKDKYINNKDSKKIEKEVTSKNYKKNTIKCKKCSTVKLKYIVERIMNIKYLSDIKKLYNLFLMEKYNYLFFYNSFFNLLDNHKNLCNLYKNIKFKLDILYKELSKYKVEKTNEIKIMNIEYQILLKNIKKTIPDDEFINLLIY